MTQESDDDMSIKVTDREKVVFKADPIIP